MNTSLHTSATRLPVEHPLGVPKAQIPLGTPLPPAYGVDAISVSLPYLHHVRGYEEGDADIHDALQAGYPRFVLSSPVKELIQAIRQKYCSKQETCLPCPSLHSAVLYLETLRHQSNNLRFQECKIGDKSVYAVIANQKDEQLLRQVWQHAGFIVSSRHAAYLLNDKPKKRNSTDRSVKELKKLIASFAHCDANDVYLFPTGMAAITCAVRIATIATHQP